MSSNGKNDLRISMPDPLVRALDALAMANGGMDRTSYLNQVLEEHVRREIHKASVLVRTMRGNPLLPAEDGGGAA